MQGIDCKQFKRVGYGATFMKGTRARLLLSCNGSAVYGVKGKGTIAGGVCLTVLQIFILKFSCRAVLVSGSGVVLRN